MRDSNVVAAAASLAEPYRGAPAVAAATKLDRLVPLHPPARPVHPRIRQSTGIRPENRETPDILSRIVTLGKCGLTALRGLGPSFRGPFV
jgi:hypothetical protein